MKINIPTKILHIYRTYYPDLPGGIQEAIRQISLSTAKNNISNTVFTLSPRPQPNFVQVDGVDVYRKKSWIAPASCDIGSVSAIKEFVRQANQHDILQYHFPWPFADCLNLTVSKNKPKILIYHSDIVKQKILGKFYAPLMWHTLKQMDVIVATSRNYVETSPVLSHPQIINKVRVIPLGINEEFYPTEGDPNILNKIPVEKSEPYFLFLGVPRYYKGIHTLIEAAKKTDSKIVIAGDGAILVELKAMVEALKLTNVIFVGMVSVSEKVSLIQHCRALILPSHIRSEAFGVVLIEASMLSKPMITCEIGTGTTFVNKDGVTGFVVPPSSPDELAEAINTLRDDEKLAKTMGEAARLRYQELFSGSALGEAYSNLYSEVLS